MDIIAYCGLNCGKCPVYIATISNDDKKRKEVLEKWNKHFNFEMNLEDINCYGCLDKEKIKFNYCINCGIRKCTLQKKLLNCAYYNEYTQCKTLNDFFVHAKEAKNNLENVRKSKLIE